MYIPGTGYQRKTNKSHWGEVLDSLNFLPLSHKDTQGANGSSKSNIPLHIHHSREICWDDLQPDTQNQSMRSALGAPAFVVHAQRCPADELHNQKWLYIDQENLALVALPLSTESLSTEMTLQWSPTNSLTTWYHLKFRDMSATVIYPPPWKQTCHLMESHPPTPNSRGLCLL